MFLNQNIQFQIVLTKVTAVNAGKVDTILYIMILHPHELKDNSNMVIYLEHFTA